MSTPLWRAISVLVEARGWTLTELAHRSELLAPQMYRWQKRPARTASVQKVGAGLGLDDTGTAALLRVAVGDTSRQPEPGTLAHRLNAAWATAHARDEPEQAVGDVAAALNGRGVAVAPQYLDLIRDGVETNPSANVVTGLAEHFGVPAGYLLGDPRIVRDVAAELDILRATRDERIQIALRQVETLPPEAKEAVASLIHTLAALEPKQHDQ